MTYKSKHSNLFFDDLNNSEKSTDKKINNKSFEMCIQNVIIAMEKFEKFSNRVDYKYNHQNVKQAFDDIEGKLKTVKNAFRLSQDDICKMKNNLYKTKGRYSIAEMRDYCLFILSNNLGKRIIDIIQLRISDIIDDTNVFNQDFNLNVESKEALNEYFAIHPEMLKDKNNYLFPSRQRKDEPITRNTAYAIIKKIDAIIDKQ